MNAMLRRILGIGGLVLVLLCATAAWLLGDRLGLTRRTVPSTVLVYDIQPPARASAEGLGEKVADAVTRRLARQGRSPFLVQARGDQQVAVSLGPGSLDPAAANLLLQGMGVLDFRIAPGYDATEPDRSEIATLLESFKENGPSAAGPTMAWFAVPRPDEVGGIITAKRDSVTYALLYTVPGKCLDHKTGMTWSIKSAHPDIDQRTGRQLIGFEFDDRGSAYFGELTGGNIGRQLAIVLDGKVLSAPRLQSRIEGQGIITGSFTARDIDYMVNILNAGALPAALSQQPVEQTTGMMEMAPVRHARAILMCPDASNNLAQRPARGLAQKGGRSPCTPHAPPVHALRSAG